MSEVKGEPQFSHPIRELVRPFLATYSSDPEGWSRRVRTIVDMALAKLPEYKRKTPGAVLFDIADSDEYSSLSSHPLDVVAEIITSGEYADIVGGEGEAETQKRHALYRAAINESAGWERVLAHQLSDRGAWGGKATELHNQSIKNSRDSLSILTLFKNSLFETVQATTLKEGAQPQSKELMPPEDISRK